MEPIIKGKIDIQECGIIEIKLMSHSMDILENSIVKRIRSETFVTWNKLRVITGRSKLKQIFSIR